MKIITFIFFLSIALNSYAQKHNDKDYYLIANIELSELSESDVQLIETSLKQYHSAKDDTTKVIALNQICENMMHDDWEKYQYFLYKFLEKSLPKSGKKEEQILLKYYANSINNIAIIKQSNGKMNEAIIFLKKSISVYKKINNQEGLAESINNLGVIYESLGNITEALECYDESISIREKINDKKGIANSLNNIGLIYNNQNDYKKALTFFNKSLALHNKLGDKNGIADANSNIGLVRFNQKDYEKSLACFRKSSEIYKEIGNKDRLALIYNNIGANYKNKKDFEQASVYFNLALEINQELKNLKGLSLTLCNLAYVEMELNNFAKAEEFVVKAKQYAIEIRTPQDIERAANLLYKIYEKQGKEQQALEMFKLHIVMRDSLNNESTQKATAQQQAKYEYEKQKVLDDAEHEKQIAIEHEAKQKQQVITYATAGGLGLVGIFLLIVFNRLKVTRKQKNIIEEQKTEVEQQKTVVEEAHHELEAKNQEITDSIQYAKRIQSAILPPSKLVKEYLQESFILYKPKDIVAGDFYWMEHKDGKVLFAAADCTGHGVPGAMVSVVCNNALNRSVREHGLTDPGEILNKTREIVIAEFEKSDEEVKDGMDIALCSLTFKVQGLKLENETLNPKPETAAMLQYAGANNPLWIIRNGEIIETKANKQPIGKFDELLPYTTHTFELQKGDSIYIFSDGYVDQFGGEKGKKFKAAAFRILLLSIQDKPMEEQKNIVNKAFENWKGNLEQIDDVCIIGVKI